MSGGCEAERSERSASDEEGREAVDTVGELESKTCRLIANVSSCASSIHTSRAASNFIPHWPCILQLLALPTLSEAQIVARSIKSC